MNGQTGEQRPMGAFSNLSPLHIFVGGLVVGILVLCTIGFFILLPMVLKGATLGAGGYVAPTPSYVPDSGNPSPGAPAVLAPVDEKVDHITGNKKAKVTVVEYSDFECPFCGRFHPTVKEALSKYGNDIRVVYRHFPLTSIHPTAVPSAEASECAAEQGKFWEFADKMFDNQTGLTSAYFSQVARDLGLNVSKFDSCVSSRKYKARVEADMASGNAAGVQGTPHTIVVGANGQQIPVSGAQPFSVLEAAIQQAKNS